MLSCIKNKTASLSLYCFVKYILTVQPRLSSISAVKDGGISSKLIYYKSDNFAEKRVGLFNIVAIFGKAVEQIEPQRFVVGEIIGKCRTQFCL